MNLLDPQVEIRGNTISISLGDGPIMFISLEQ